MGDPKGFLKVSRKTLDYRPVCERIKDYREVCRVADTKHSKDQSSRCMDCGTPFCHWGCPVGNYIPEWNDLVFQGRWDKAYQLLAATNNFPEITGRICPAPCEYSCVLGINDEAVTIRENELAVIEEAFKKGYIRPHPPKIRTGKQVAVIGSGPAGLACAEQLNRAGHLVTVFEKSDKIGGILRYGIPDFKLEKMILDRRIELLKKERIIFKTSACAGKEPTTEYLQDEFDAVCLAIGSSVPRDLKIEGRELKGIHFAMDYLIQANRRVSGEKYPPQDLIDAKNKRVVVIGGGDTGADCVGVGHRQGAECVVQIELLAQPPACRSEDFPWPKYPLLLKTTSSHQEGGERVWSVLTKKFIGENGTIKKLSCVEAKLEKDKKNGCSVINQLNGREFEIEADLVILAMGFLHPRKEGIIDSFNLALDKRGNLKTDENFMSSKQGVFACGDAHRGQSLVVWAIWEGRQCADSIDKYLKREGNTAKL